MKEAHGVATGDKLVTLDDLKAAYDNVHIPSKQLQITTGQWSGSGPYTITASATNVTADSIVDWQMDSSINYLASDLTVTTGAGTVTLSTATKPTNTINITLFFPGTTDDVDVQVLSDVYSKSQVDTLLAAKVSTSNIVNDLTINNANKVASQAEVYTINNKLIPHDDGYISVSGSNTYTVDNNNTSVVYFYLGDMKVLVYLHVTITFTTNSVQKDVPIFRVGVYEIDAVPIAPTYIPCQIESSSSPQNTFVRLTSNHFFGLTESFSGSGNKTLHVEGSFIGQLKG